MEDVLEVYSRAPQQDRPLVCMDECAKQLLSEARAPVAAIPGQLARDDYEYVLEGREERFDESGAAQGPGGLHVTNASGPSECGSNLVECFTELDGLEVLGF